MWLAESTGTDGAGLNPININSQLWIFFCERGEFFMKTRKFLTYNIFWENHKKIWQEFFCSKLDRFLKKLPEIIMFPSTKILTRVPKILVLNKMKVPKYIVWWKIALDRSPCLQAHWLGPEPWFAHIWYQWNKRLLDATMRIIEHINVTSFFSISYYNNCLK